MARLANLAIWLACAAAACASLALMLWDILRHGTTERAWRIAIALDQSANAAARGWPDETLSSRAYRLRAQPKWARWEARINRLFDDPRHCRDSYESERKRRQLPPDMRDET